MESPSEGSSKDGGRPVISFLTGPVHSGKTTFLRKAVRELKEHGFAVDGFLSIPLEEGGNEAAAGYDLFFVKRGERIPFIRAVGGGEWEKITSRRPRFLDPRGLAAAKETIRACGGADLFIADEVGPLELAGKGLWPALEERLGRQAGEGAGGGKEAPAGAGAPTAAPARTTRIGAFLLVVRQRLLDEAVRKLDLEEPAAVLDISDESLSAAALAGIAASGRARRGVDGETIPVKKTDGKSE